MLVQTQEPVILIEGAEVSLSSYADILSLILACSLRKESALQTDYEGESLGRAVSVVFISVRLST